MDKQTPALTQLPPQPEEGSTDPGADSVTTSSGQDSSPLDDPAAATVAEPEAARGSDAPPPAAPVPAASEPARGGGRLALVLSIIALIGLGVIGWQMYESRQSGDQLRLEVADRLSSADARATESRALSRQAQESIATLQGRFGALESKVAASEGQTAALESLYQEFSRTRSDRALAEVTQAVAIAGQQLRLAGNYEAALIALQAAESRLAAPELGHLHDLRRALMKDIDEVKSHPQVDVSGLALRLELLLGHVDRLPLAYAVEPLGTPAAMPDPVAPVEPVAEDQRWWRDMLGFARSLGSDAWNEVRAMIRLERMDQADPALLAPTQGVYLRENVKIRLLTARLALLGSDARTYAADLAMARDWLNRYFDTRDAQVQRVLTEIAALEAIDMRAEPPTLNDTFAALGMVRSRGANGANGSAEAGEAASAAPAAEAR